MPRSSPSYERENIRKSALSAYARRDPKAAMEFLQTLEPGMRSRMLPDTFQQLARKEPEAAIEWVRKEPDSYAKGKALEDSAYYLANSMPEETIKLAREYPEMQSRILDNAFGSIARNDLNKAMELAKEWESEPQYSNILRGIANSYARENPEQAFEWAQSLPAEHQSNVLSSIVSRIAGDDPSMASDFLGKMAVDTPQQQSAFNNALQNIASNWAHNDPVAAAEWLQAMPDSDASRSGLQQVAEQWARVDPISASEWIGSLPAGEGRDSAAGALIHRIRRDDPERAIAWAESMSNESTRNSHLRNVYQDWIRRDSTKALESLADSPLPDDWKRNLVPELNGNPQPVFESGGGVIRFEAR